MTTMQSERSTGTGDAVRFRALGTYVHVATTGAVRLREAGQVARDVLDQVDRECSRFRDDSDLSRANRTPGRRAPAGPVLRGAVRSAIAVADQTDGLVTPLLGREMVSLGYDRDFGELRPTYSEAPSSTPADIDAWRRIELGPDWVVVPEGTALDLGSTGKAWASDLVAARVSATLEVGVLVSLGGDIAVAGPGTDSHAWPIEIREHPDAAHPDQVVHLTGGGLATSSTRVRRWRRGSVEQHHVLDPRTGGAAAEVWRTVTATGPTCAAANAASTAAIVLGADAPAWLAQRHVDARLVATDGNVLRLGSWPEVAR
ncbi:MAG TPA: FAD:protein FMN transferase [Marmoricola sp.]|nr:FAD:protein FMN transferase [Marmoricola sp.]